MGRVEELEGPGKVTSAYRKWYEYLLLSVRLAMPTQVPYTAIHTESLVGLFTCVFVKNTERMSVKDNVITSMKRGMGGRYENKVYVSFFYAILDLIASNRVES
jgi:hypothetical protein